MRMEFIFLKNVVISNFIIIYFHLVFFNTFSQNKTKNVNENRESNRRYFQRNKPNYMVCFEFKKNYKIKK